MVREAALEQTEEGLVPAGEGWFVLNTREARWFERGGQGAGPSLQGAGRTSGSSGWA